jgi:hypothetical protein
MQGNQRIGHEIKTGGINMGGKITGNRWLNAESAFRRASRSFFYHIPDLFVYPQNLWISLWIGWGRKDLNQPAISLFFTSHKNEAFIKTLINNML